MNTHNQHRLAWASLGLALLCSPLVKAATFTFHVNIDTTALVSAANGPFLLDFQLNEGSGTLPNSVTLSNFTFDNGAATGSASIFGNASGSLSGGIVLNDNSVDTFNEIFQGFSATTTGIHFDVVTSQSSPGATPDTFSASILDSESGNPQITTNAPDGVSLITLNIGTANTLADVGVYDSLSPSGVSASAVSAIPEPSTTAALFGAAVMGMAGFHRFRSSRKAA